MTRKENLIALRDAVVGGDFKNAVVCAAGVGNSYVSYDIYANIMDAYNSDMNAALFFVADVLPGWEWQIDRDGARVWIDNPDKGPFASECHPVSRALLIAALNALIEETDE